MKRKFLMGMMSRQMTKPMFRPDDGAGSGESKSGGEGNGEGDGEEGTKGGDGNSRHSDEEIQKLIDEKVKAEKAKWEKELEDKQSEAEKLKDMTKAQKEQYEAEKRIKELEKRELEITTRELKAQAYETLAEKGLPKELIDTLSFKDAESCNNSINAVEKAFKKAVEVQVNEKLKGGKLPKGKGGADRSLTMDDVNNMSVAEINANWDKIKNIK